jgi:5-methylthioadenosine/S-adenosylhomocysteine deaminase
MRTAALLAKAVAGDAEAMPAHAALRAATLGGASALGLASVTGSIEPGKAADLAAVDLSAPELAPCYDPVSHLVYAAGREHVSDVWISGERRVQGGALLPEALSVLDTRWRIWQNALEDHADS